MLPMDAGVKQKHDVEIIIKAVLQNVGGQDSIYPYRALLVKAEQYDLLLIKHMQTDYQV